MLELQDIVFEVPLAEGSRETKRIIDGISLTIDTDKFVVITGPNGGGKSTLAKLIMGIEKPTSGKIIFKGQDITNASITERARMGVGYGFQQPARFKGMKVKKLLELAAGKRLPMLACNEYLSEVGLCSANYLTREVDKSLSGGELKRIEIATVLAANPDLAIYDEPEAGIDLWSFDRLTPNVQAALQTGEWQIHHHHLPPGAHHRTGRRDHLPACGQDRVAKAAWKRSFPNSDFLPKRTTTVRSPSLPTCI